MRSKSEIDPLTGELRTSFPRGGEMVISQPNWSILYTKKQVDALIAAIPGGGGGGAVSSVFTRTGAVVATSGDYAASLVTNDSTVTGATVKDALNTLLAGGGGGVAWGAITGTLSSQSDLQTALTARMLTSTYDPAGVSQQLLGTTATQNVSNKTLDNTNVATLQASNFTLQDPTDNTKQAQFVLSGITTGTTHTYTLPNGNATLAALTIAQTFSAIKTFSATPVFSTGAITGSSSNTLTLPTISTNLVGRSTTDALTNKDLTSTTNTFPPGVFYYQALTFK